MSFPFFRQSDKMDCGPTCLRMVAKYHKKNISLQYLRDKTEIGKGGVNLLGISDAAETIGFRTQSVKLDFTTLATDAKLPVILHWNQNHFVVLYKIKRKKLFVADPAKDLIVYKEKDFKQNWISDKGEEGVALLLDPSPAFHKNEYGQEEQRKLNFKNIIYYILPFKKLVFQLFIGIGVASLLQLFLPFLTQSIVDTGINTGNIHFIYIFIRITSTVNYNNRL